MPTYTIELKDLLDDFKPENVSRDEYLGLADYPLYDPDYRLALNDKIVNHYYTREIGLESIPMWQFAMRRKMFEIMPYFNALYESTQMEFDPFKTVSLSTTANATANQQSQESTTSTAETTGTEESTGTNTSEGQALDVKTQYSMPQQQINSNGNYATAAAEGENVSTGSGTASEERNTSGETSGEQASTGTVDTEQSNTSNVSGYQGMPAQMLLAYRATILNIDMLIIEAVEELFMLVWNNSDETLPPMRGYGI